jgi:hypothetical protein
VAPPWNGARTPSMLTQVKPWFAAAPFGIRISPTELCHESGLPRTSWMGCLFFSHMQNNLSESRL